MLELRDGTRKSDKPYLLTRTCIKPTNKLVSSLSGAPLVQRQATGNSGLTRLTTTRTLGSHHIPPYIILCIFPRHLHPNGFLSRDSQGRVPKQSQLRVSRIWELITLSSDLRLGLGLKQTCSSPQELSNGVLHSTCTHRGRVDSRLLVVGSQTASLTPGPSFDHNLCYKYSNGSCKVIFDIFTLRPF